MGGGAEIRNFLTSRRVAVRWEEVALLAGVSHRAFTDLIGELSTHSET